MRCDTLKADKRTVIDKAKLNGGIEIIELLSIIIGYLLSLTVIGAIIGVPIVLIGIVLFVLGIVIVCSVLFILMHMALIF